MAKQSRLVVNKKTGAVHENRNMKTKPKAAKPVKSKGSRKK